MATKGQTVASDLSALLRARNSLIWIVTREEGRAESLIFEAAASAGYVAHCWDVAQGASELSGQKLAFGGNDPSDMLGAIRGRAAQGNSRDVWIMRDLPVWLEGPPGASTLRTLRNLVRFLPSVPRAGAQALIVLTTNPRVPDELQGDATIIDWPLPDREEIAAILDAAIASLPDDLKVSAAPNGTRDSAIDAAIGLTSNEASSCYARSLVKLRRIDPSTVAGEKKRVITREKVLEWYDPIPGGLDAVGGLENLKAWLNARKLAYSPQARAYGLPAPKGALLVGVPGCGKSLTAKAIATAWGVPLLRLDLGALKSKYVGESEGNLRKAFKVIESVGRCVVWLDEIEKALAGATQGAADGGVSSDALGSILSFMQERQGEAFVIATANDVSALPLELTRKGRFDEIFFVDLPNFEEREAIIRTSLKGFGVDATEIDCPRLALHSDGFTGAELAAIVPDAMFSAFAENARAVMTGDLYRAMDSVVPLSKSASEKITKLREWAKERARPASLTVERVSGKARELDIA